MESPKLTQKPLINVFTEGCGLVLPVVTSSPELSSTANTVKENLLEILTKRSSDKFAGTGC